MSTSDVWMLITYVNKRCMDVKSDVNRLVNHNSILQVLFENLVGKPID